MSLSSLGFKAFLTLTVFGACYATAHSTHMRGGEIEYRHLGGTSHKYEITFKSYVSLNSIGGDSIKFEFFYCNISNPFSTKWVALDSFYNYPGLEDVKIQYYTIEVFTFPSPGCYQLAITDPNRMEGIINIVSSVNVPFSISDTLFLNDPQFFGFNSSVRFEDIGVQLATVEDIFKYQPQFTEPDGDSLVWQLVVPLAGPGNPVPGYTFPDDPKHTSGAGLPNDFSIDPHSGVVTWIVPQIIGTYSVAIKVREFHEGQLVGTMHRDMQIIVQEPTGVDDAEVGGLKIGPNPATHEVLISARKNEVLQVFIFDMAGRPCFQGARIQTLHRVDVGKWPDGVYLVKWEDDHGRAGSQKFVKIKE